MQRDQSMQPSSPTIAPFKAPLAVHQAHPDMVKHPSSVSFKQGLAVLEAVPPSSPLKHNVYLRNVMKRRAENIPPAPMLPPIHIIPLQHSW